MNQIILDAYYLIGLFQERDMEINLDKLTNLLYLLEAYYMFLFNKEYLYEEQFKIRSTGLYVNELEDLFSGYNIFDWIKISQNEIELGNKITDERKDMIYDIFSAFGKLNAHKLRELIRSGESLVEKIYESPDYMSCYMLYSIGLSKEQTKDWFINNLLVRMK